MYIYRLPLIRVCVCVYIYIYIYIYIYNIILIKVKNTAWDILQIMYTCMCER